MSPLSTTQMLNFTDDSLNNEGNIRNVLDVGCGVASFGGYLLSSNIIAMSLAPNDVHQNQIQFALERGIPAYLGVLGTKRLPYPSRSFELAHCSRCRIDWLQRDGILLLELDRLLRPGGYFAYSSPEAYAKDEEDLRIWREMSALVERMCWKIAAKRNQTVIWVKPLTNDCYMDRAPGVQPQLCQKDDDPDAVWGVNMQACITPYTAREFICLPTVIVCYFDHHFCYCYHYHDLFPVSCRKKGIIIIIERRALSSSSAWFLDKDWSMASLA